MRTALAMLGLLLATAPPAGPASRAESGPPGARATLVLEPATLELGAVGTLEIAARTAPDTLLRPYVTPRSEDLWLLDVETLEPREQEGHWLHRVRIRVRPRSLGSLAWPESEVVAVDAEGRETRIPVPGRRLEVRPTLAPGPGLGAPEGLLRARPPAPGGGWGRTGVAAALGLALGALAGALLERRRRAGRLAGPGADGPPAAPSPGAPDLFAWTEAELARAGADLEGDPAAALNRASSALRRFASRRFGRDLAARTTRELEGAEPPLAGRSRWPSLLRLLRELDDLRFRPVEGPGADQGRAERSRRAIEGARRFVAEARPGGRTR